MWYFSKSISFTVIPLFPKFDVSILVYCFPPFPPLKQERKTNHESWTLEGRQQYTKQTFVCRYRLFVLNTMEKYYNSKKSCFTCIRYFITPQRGEVGNQKCQKFSIIIFLEGGHHFRFLPHQWLLSIIFERPLVPPPEWCASVRINYCFVCYSLREFEWISINVASTLFISEEHQTSTNLLT